jgi:pyruvate dehydrogenase E2 component (dihydrolipoamide acetyltransferase)
MVTSVGMFGVQKAYGPLSPLYRIPVLALVSEVTVRPVVVDGEIVARPLLTITATMDHRYLDGSHAARLARSVRAFLESPAAYDPVPVNASAEEAAHDG